MADPIEVDEATECDENGCPVVLPTTQVIPQSVGCGPWRALPMPSKSAKEKAESKITAKGKNPFDPTAAKTPFIRER